MKKVLTENRLLPLILAVLFVLVIGWLIPSNAQSPLVISLTGDVQTTGPNALKVTGLQGKAISATVPTTGQEMQYNGTQWASANPTVVAAGTITITSGTSGKHSFPAGNPIPAGSACDVWALFNPGTLPGLTYWPSNTTTDVTVNLSQTVSGTYNFGFECVTPLR